MRHGWRAIIGRRRGRGNRIINRNDGARPVDVRQITRCRTDIRALPDERPGDGCSSSSSPRRVKDFSKGDTCRILNEYARHTVLGAKLAEEEPAAG